MKHSHGSHGAHDHAKMMSHGSHNHAGHSMGKQVMTGTMASAAASTGGN